MARSDGIYRIIVLGDIHLPMEDKRTIAAVESYIADQCWDEWIQIGDFMDFDELSRFTQENLRVIGQSGVLRKNYDYANKWLDRHQAAVRNRNRNVKFTMLQGNHDYRVVPYTEKDPRLTGLIEPEFALNFKDRGINYVKFWENKKPYKVGNAYFAHGLYTGQHHAKKMVDTYGVNIFYGHLHDVQSHGKVLMGKDSTIMGQCVGFLGRYDMPYVGYAPTNWQQAFCTVNILPDGYFHHHVTRIFKHRFVSPEGKLYSA